MEQTEIVIEDLEIGKIRYSFEALVIWTDNSEPATDDYPAFYDWDIDQVDLIGKITAYDTEEDREYWVTDQLEICNVIDSVDWETELEKTF